MATSKPHLIPLIGTALLGALLLLAWGCSRSVTSPVSSDTVGSPGETARVVVPGDLDAGATGAVDLAQVIHEQPAVELALRERNPRLLGTAVSAFHGRPVVLALTRVAVDDLPARVAGREVAQLVIGDVTAQSFYCGTSTGESASCNAGTLGGIVTDGTRNYWLSNWHVIARTNPFAGEAVVSPGRADAACGASNTVGALTRWSTVRFDGSYNHLDCAIARIGAGVSVSAIEAAGSNSFLPSATTQAPVIGVAVKKVGNTTGLTTGKITAINASLTVGYGAMGAANFAGLVLFSLPCKPGDSGSLICTQSGNNPVALLFAASPTFTVGCPINQVFTAMGVHIAN